MATASIAGSEAKASADVDVGQTHVRLTVELTTCMKRSNFRTILGQTRFS